MNAKCPSCGAKVKLENDVVTGEIIECTSCGEELEVTVKEDTATLEFAPDVEEDWGE